MAKVYELPKRFHPDFSTLGVKPKGPFSIDWAHPVTSSLKNLLVCGNQGVNLHDLVPGTTQPVQEGTNAITPGVYGGEVGLDFANTTATTSDVNARYQLNATGEMSEGFVLCRFICSDFVVGNAGYIYAVPVTTGNHRLYLFCNNTGTGCGLGSTSNLGAITSGVDTSTVYTVLFTWDSGANVETYVDGRLGELNTTYAGGSPGGPTDTFYHLGCLQNPSLGAQSPFDGQVHLLAVGDMHINQALGLSLTADPYQILKPAIPMVYFVPAAARRRFMITA